MNGTTVFLYRNCHPLANTVIPVLNCEGVTQGVLNDMILPSEIEEETLIWKNQDSACALDNFGNP
ncbi:Hypothetical protein I595_3607 [Croceitalea dokdonensis DOKDO 023]|uniref:Uncharacterized protein n=1 Tax=Croceitalea dokdonensis DOKDO 023 TaxID=1300341 RepID=A0A0P7AVC5_9FLAO|nr:hypothetical protein [Croceitalea dokdonensis]KPM30311.1 Hypothetical protein I595_3607 [Croceitalea dokdonensis DOKDO 023]